MKIILATAVLLGAATPALAGPYVNVESNSAFIGRDGQDRLSLKHIQVLISLLVNSAKCLCTRWTSISCYLK